MDTIGDLDFNEMTFGRSNQSFEDPGSYTPPYHLIKSPSSSKSPKTKREKQLEVRIKNNPQIFLDSLSEEERKKLIPIPKNNIKKGGRKTKRKTNKTKKFKKHFMWNTKGKRYIAKTRKQHLKGVKYGHTHKKPKTQKRVKRGSGDGDYEKKKRIYTAYKLIPGKRYDIIVKRKIDGEMYKIPQIFKDVAFDSFYTRPIRSSMRRISPRRNRSSKTDHPTLEIAKFKYNEDKNSLVYISFDSLNEFYELESLGDQLKKSKEVNALAALDKSTRGIEDLKREIAKYGGKN